MGAMESIAESLRRIVKILESERGIGRWPEKVRGLSMDSMDFSVRVRNAMSQNGFNTVGDLEFVTEKELLKNRALGRTSITEVRRKIRDLGVEWN